MIVEHVAWEKVPRHIVWGEYEGRNVVKEKILWLILAGLPVNSKTSQPPGIPRVFDWSFAPYSGEFDPKWGPTSRAFDFPVKTLVRVSKKGFRNSFHF